MWDLSSPTRDQTCVPCFARQILYHWATRKVPWRIYFSIVCSADLQWQILWFCLFENMLCRLSVWNILLSWRIFLLDIELVGFFFFFLHLKLSLSFIVSDEKSAIFISLFPCIWYTSFSSGYFVDSLYLLFSNVIMVWSSLYLSHRFLICNYKTTYMILLNII